MKRILLSAVAAFMFSGVCSAQETYYKEDFEAGVPADWTIDGEWAHGDASTLSSEYLNFAGNATSFIAFNDDGAGGSHVGGGRALTGAIDLTAVTGDVWLEMNTFFVDGDYLGSDETFKVLVSTDDGVTFNEIKDFAGVAWQYEVIDFSAYAGQTIRIAFDYDDGAAWNFGAAIDDVSLVSEPINAVRRSYAITANGANVMTECAANQDYAIEGVFINGGYEPVTSFEVVVTQEGQEIMRESFSGVSLVKGDGVRYEMPEMINTGESTSSYAVSVTNVNGETEEDDNAENNTVAFSFTPVDLNPDQAVVVEEATGTWCQWCPRGTVFIDEMSKRFGDNFVGIAVHNNDPMVLAEYDNNMNVAGYPSAIFNRSTEIDPGDIKEPSIAAMQQSPTAIVELGAKMDGSSLTTSVRATFLEDVTAGNFKVVVVLTEDDLAEEGPGWNQVNAYSGGGVGPMGGFELLPGSVPASWFPYSHVGRALIGGYNGVSAVSGDIAANTSKNTEMPVFNMPAEWNTEKMHIVAMLLNAQGDVVNAKSMKFEDAIANGPTSTVEIEDESLALAYPNPAYDYTNLTINVGAATNVNVEVIDFMGKTVDMVNLGRVVGQQTIPVDVSAYPAGNYIFKVIAGERVNAQKITVVK